jgi:NAD(P)-dependent dehydrogenase (short-subunit alcohol dehydrogenase family)
MSDFRSRRFDKTVALITGAANGIGRATAQLIAADGGSCVIVDRDEAALQELCVSVRQCGGSVRAFAADVLDPSDVANVVQTSARELGRIDVLVNGVGGSTIIERPAATIDELTLEDWRALLTFNLEGTFLFCRDVVPIMKRQRRGKIVNVSSIAARGLAARASSAYAAAKGGIGSLTLKLANELGPYGITVNAVAPGVTLTERMKEQWMKRPDAERQGELERIPLRRFAEPIDQARVIAFLASTDADFVTGAVIDVAGGL